MPLAARRHKHDGIEQWLWGLLPDNENVLARWARRFQVSARSAFSLLTATGEDCLALARALGIPAARSRVSRFGDETAIVVERYDRIRAGGRLVRLHQEDVCQTLGRSPLRKHENEGGPGCRDIAAAIRSHCRPVGEDLRTFGRASATVRQPAPRTMTGPWNKAIAPSRLKNGRCWTRTSDPYDVSVVLYRLS